MNDGHDLTGCSHEQPQHDPDDTNYNAGCCAEVNVDDAGQEARHGCCGGAAASDRHSVA